MRRKLPSRSLPVHYSLLNQPLDIVLPELLRILSSFLFSGYWVLPRGVKRPKHFAKHPPPSSVSLRMSWNYTSISPLCLFRQVRVTFTFTESIVKYTKNMQISSIKYGEQERYMQYFGREM